MAEPVEVDVRWTARRDARRPLRRAGDARALRPGRAGPSSLLEALARCRRAPGHTTNLTVVDAAGNACVLTTSLGLGSGDWLPGLDLHLNSMLGEADLIRGPLEPSERMASMMAPTLVFDADGLELAIGSAGGTRLRTALVGVLGAVLARGARAAGGGRPAPLPPGRQLLNAEPGVDEAWLAALEERGWTVRRWPARHHYFGGVSAVGRTARPPIRGEAAPSATARTRRGALELYWLRSAAMAPHARSRIGSSTSCCGRARRRRPTRVLGSTRSASCRRSSPVTSCSPSRRHPARISPTLPEHAWHAATQFYRWLVFLTNSVQTAMLRFFYPDATG